MQKNRLISIHICACFSLKTQKCISLHWICIFALDVSFWFYTGVRRVTEIFLPKYNTEVFVLNLKSTCEKIIRYRHKDHCEIFENGKNELKNSRNIENNPPPNSMHFFRLIFQRLNASSHPFLGIEEKYSFTVTSILFSELKRQAGKKPKFTHSKIRRTERKF